MKTNAGAKRRRRLAATAAPLCALVASLAVVAPPAFAETGGVVRLPEFIGITYFPVIHGPTDPDEFSWQVRLGDDQTLDQVSETEAWVEYEDGLMSFAITAQPAKDAVGMLVPTTVRVSEGGVLTLVVHDREGNFAAGGGPYTYPIVPADLWESEEVLLVEVNKPADESELEAERLAAQRPSAPGSSGTTSEPAARCTVPPLRNLSLHAAEARLRGADCGVGQIRLAHGTTRSKGKVVKQFRPAGTQLAAGAPVAVKLGGHR